MIVLLVLLLLFSLNFSVAQPGEKFLPPKEIMFHYKPTQWPDRILLSISDQTSATRTVSWRQNADEGTYKAQLAIADASPYFNDYEKDYIATSSEVLSVEGYTSKYHHVVFRDLEPGKHYVYRVGNGSFWSKWIPFSMPVKDDTIRLLYFGDAQNKVYSHCSRVFQAGFNYVANADLAIHVGDLINHADNDYEWGEWFQAGEQLHQSIPTLVLPGNHEYIKNSEGVKVNFTRFWDVQFKLPHNGPATLKNHTYCIDYQDIRLIVLDSNTELPLQAAWLNEKLESHTKKWVILAFHHPLYSGSRGKQNDGLIAEWLPVIQEHPVDLILQGHDHVYARGQLEPNGPVMVVSVSGEKMYELQESDWIDRGAENTQLFQSIRIAGDRLMFEALLPDNTLYDRFTITKKGDDIEVIDYPNLPDQRRSENTLIEK